MSEHIKEIHQSGNVTILKLAKSITLNNLKDVQSEFSEATKNIEIHNILFDLGEVPETDSAGIAGLIDLLRYMKGCHNDGKVGLVHLSVKMKSLLSVLKVEPLFKVYASVDEAQRELGKI